MTGVLQDVQAPTTAEAVGLHTVAAPLRLADLCAQALRALQRMYRPEDRLFVFRLRREAAGRTGGAPAVVAEGRSVRYTAIAVIGLATEDAASQRTVLGPRGLLDPCDRLVAELPHSENLGDVALTLWATAAADHAGRAAARQRLADLRPDRTSQPTVELAWTLAALVLHPAPGDEPLRRAVAARLVASFDPASAMFPHHVGGPFSGLRDHVSCFADLVYPIHALACHGQSSGDPAALRAAIRCARAICDHQGPAGQWWWHYDRRTGRIIEPYPVYAIHQDAMAPMALFAAAAATGQDFGPAIRRGLEWIRRPPELGGASLIDPEADLVWRKVARHEVAKLARYVQAGASRLHRRIRVPGLDVVLPPGVIDYEDRPYHLGWLLHAWPPERRRVWDARVDA
jgi:hypothetical protein